MPSSSNCGEKRSAARERLQRLIDAFPKELWGPLITELRDLLADVVALESRARDAEAERDEWKARALAAEASLDDAINLLARFHSISEYYETAEFVAAYRARRQPNDLPPTETHQKPGAGPTGTTRPGEPGQVPSAANRSFCESWCGDAYVHGRSGFVAATMGTADYRDWCSAQCKFDKARRDGGDAK